MGFNSGFKGLKEGLHKFYCYWGHKFATKTLFCNNQYFYIVESISYQFSNNVKFKLAKFLQLIGTIKRTIFRKVRTETILKIYNTLVLPTFLYGSENWTLDSLTETPTHFIRRVPYPSLGRDTGCTERGLSCIPSDSQGVSSHSTSNEPQPAP